MALPVPQLIEIDYDKIVSEMVLSYETKVGRKLEPAQIETLLIQTFSYREMLLRNQIQNAGLQNLIEYAIFPMLDHLGAFLGVQRLPAALARTTIEFTLVAGHGDVVIPNGMRVTSSDGRAVFELIEDVSVLSGVNTATAMFVAQTAGKSFNDYAIGTISVILDPQSYLSAVSNLTVTAGGSDEENDEQLRGRIKLAPSAFSNAGSRKAYEFWAKSASPLIIDVAIQNQKCTVNNEPIGLVVGDDIPGTVEIFPLIESLEATPMEILIAVEAVLTDEKIRPLTDTVIVSSPTVIATDINIGLILYDWAVQSDVLPVVLKKITDFKNLRKKILGQDLVLDQLKALCMIDGVYKTSVTSPATDLVVLNTEFVKINAINITVTGTNIG